MDNADDFGQVLVGEPLLHISMGYDKEAGQFYVERNGERLDGEAALEVAGMFSNALGESVFGMAVEEMTKDDRPESYVERMAREQDDTFQPPRPPRPPIEGE